MSGRMYVLALNPCYCIDIYDDKTNTMHGEKKSLRTMGTIAGAFANDRKFEHKHYLVYYFY